MLYDSLSNGRNMPEIIRLIKALPTTDRYLGATPANWQPRDNVVVPDQKTRTRWRSN